MTPTEEAQEQLRQGIKLAACKVIRCNNCCSPDSFGKAECAQISHLVMPLILSHVQAREAEAEARGMRRAAQVARNMRERAAELQRHLGPLNNAQVRELTAMEIAQEIDALATKAPTSEGDAT